MFELLLYSGIACPDADVIMLRIKANEHLNDAVKVELIETLKKSVPECYWDAND